MKADLIQDIKLEHYIYRKSVEQSNQGLGAHNNVSLMSIPAQKAEEYTGTVVGVGHGWQGGRTWRTGLDLTSAPEE